MAFTKGKARPANAGRKKGTPNKKTQDLLERCAQRGVDPFEVLLELCQSDDDAIRLQAAKEACKYIHPQRKAIEMSNPEGEGFKVVVEDYGT